MREGSVPQRASWYLGAAVPTGSCCDLRGMVARIDVGGCLQGTVAPHMATYGEYHLICCSEPRHGSICPLVVSMR